MREFFVERDLISAEVQQYFQDGSVAIHTRSLKYGKLKCGQLICVSPSLIKRCKNHFVDLAIGVHVILGTNGYIWISGSLLRSTTTRTITGEHETDAMATDEQTEEIEITVAIREKIARVRNCIVALSMSSIPIYPPTILATYEAGFHLPIPSLIHNEYFNVITQPAKEILETD
jgi:exosome complex component RRP4